MNDLISVVMPIYNHAEFLEESIPDLLNQTYRELDIILVDDGSTDNTLEVIHKYEKMDSRIRCVSKPNGGTGSAMNAGFEIARGKYGSWASADDRKFPQCMEKLHECFVKYPEAGLAFASFITANAMLQGTECALVPEVKPGETVILKDFVTRMFTMCITGICFMFSMKLKLACGPYEDMPGEDYIMGTRMGIAMPVVYTRQILGIHRNHSKSLSNMDPTCVAKANIKAHNLAYNFLKQIKAGVNT